MQSTNEFSPKKQSAAPGNGYLIIRICLLDVLPICRRYCGLAAVRLVKGTSPNATRYDMRSQPSAYGLGKSDSFAVPSAINWPASYREATFSLAKINLASTAISGRRFSIVSGSNFDTSNS
jgi:hypothetical protein